MIASGITAPGVSPLQIGDPVTVREIGDATRSPAALAGSSTPPSGPRSINLTPYTSVGTGTRAIDVILNVPLNLSRLNPAITRVRIQCEMGSVGSNPGGAAGVKDVEIVAGQFIGTVSVYARSNADAVQGGIPPGTVMRYYCLLDALNAAGYSLPGPDLGRGEFRGDFTW